MQFDLFIITAVGTVVYRRLYFYGGDEFELRSDAQAEIFPFNEKRG